jgi:hypothetical protein
MTPPPAQLVRRLGVAESSAAATVALMAILQYIFLIQLWFGHPLRWVGDLIHENVVFTGLTLSLVGVVALVVGSTWYWSAATKGASRLQRPAVDKSFDGLKRLLAQVVARSSLSEPPELFYTPKNAQALQVTTAPDGHSSIVVGLDQRSRAASEPEIMAAMLGHEVSHVELGATQSEITIRRTALLHFRILAWVTAVFTVTLGFIDRTGLGSRPQYFGFVPVFDWTIYRDLSEHFCLLLLSSAIVFIYSYFFVVRREHVHDLRGSQLAQNNSLADRLFGPASIGMTLRTKFADFLELHPSANARARVIRERDVVLLSAVLFPLIVGGIPGPLLQLLTAGWQHALGGTNELWNLALTVVGGLLFFLILSADLVRLGLSAILIKRHLLKIPVYALCAGVATQIPRILFEMLYGIRKGFPWQQIIVRITSGFWNGGIHVAAMVTLTLLALSYISAFRIALYGEARAGQGVTLDRIVGSIALIGAFAFISLTSRQLQIRDLAFITAILGARIGLAIAFARCPSCRRSLWSALGLSTRCRCGQERLPYLRSVVAGSVPHPVAATTRGAAQGGT